MNTTDILYQLKSKLDNKDFRITKNGIKTVELQDVHFECDKTYIIPNLNCGLDLSWYSEFYEPLLFDKKYGDQFNNCINTLINEPTSRQAVLQMIDRNVYNEDGFICTFNMQCFLNDNKLVYIVNMRSNDVARYPLDLLWQTKIQKMIANTLSEKLCKRIATSNIRWNAGSLHIYEKDFEFLAN